MTAAWLVGWQSVLRVAEANSGAPERKLAWRMENRGSSEKLYPMGLNPFARHPPPKNFEWESGWRRRFDCHRRRNQEQGNSLTERAEAYVNSLPGTAFWQRSPSPYVFAPRIAKNGRFCGLEINGPEASWHVHQGRTVTVFWRKYDGLSGDD